MISSHIVLPETPLKFRRACSGTVSMFLFTPFVLSRIAINAYSIMDQKWYDLSEPCAAVRMEVFSMAGTMTDLQEVYLCFLRMP